MRETIILADGLSGNELRRSLAKRGRNSLCIRVVGTVELAKISLIRNGFAINKRIVDKIEQAAIVYTFLNEIDYFKNASYTDAINLVSAFHTMRSCIVEGDELDEIRDRLQTDDFVMKNNAIAEAFVRYSNYLYQNDLTDNDAIIHDAINHAKVIDSDFIVLNEIKTSACAKKLIDIVSGGNVSEMSIKDIFDIRESDTDNIDVSMAYGAVNEIEDVMEDIYTNHKLDECVIAITNEKAYSQLIYNLSLQYNIPVSFGCGISINNSNPAKLLKQLVFWDNLGYNGVEALYDLLSCEALDWRFLAPALGINDNVGDKFIRNLSEYAGNLKLSCDEKSNNVKLSKINKHDEMYEFATKLAKIFEKGIIYFLQTFVLLRDGAMIDEVALSGILRDIEIFEKYNPGKLMTEVIPQITSTNICSNISSEGKIHVTNLLGLFACSRPYVYICGLSAKEFPGSAKENYLLLDSDLKRFEGSVNSEQRILNKISLFENVLNFANLASDNIKLSYSYFDLSELKEQNASSVLYKIVDDFEQCRKVGFFDANLSRSRLIGREYKNGVEVDYSIDPKKPFTDENLFDRSWSFSAINTYFTCPRKFFLKNVLRIPEVEKVDPFEVLNAAEIGTIAHDLMRMLGNCDITKVDFLYKARAAFDEFILHKPALIVAKMENVRSEFLDMMALSYDQDMQNSATIQISETNIEAVHEKTGLKLHGLPDRVENNGQQNIVVDFKTGRDVKHKENDAKTCLQVLIYAFLYEENNMGIKIDRGEFRYLRNSAIIPCAYDDDAREDMDKLLEEFAFGLRENNFVRCTKDCKYCSYSDICLWPGEIDEESDEGE